MSIVEQHEMKHKNTFQNFLINNSNYFYYFLLFKNLCIEKYPEQLI